MVKQEDHYLDKSGQKKEINKKKYKKRMSKKDRA